MATTKPLWIAIGLLPCLLFAAPARAQQYTIKLEHAEKPGETVPLDVDAKNVEGTTLTVQGQAPQDSHQSSDAQLTGERKVVAVNERGVATKLSITVSTCTSDGKPVVPPGTVILAERTGTAPATYTVDGAPADEATAKVMAMVIDMDDPTMPDDDAAFGTTQPQKPGDSWPINTEAAMKGAANIGIPLKKENLSGTTTLVGVDKVDGKDVLKIKGNMDIKNLSGPGPGGMALQNGQITGSFDETISAADATVPVTQNRHFSMHLVGQVPGPNGQSITLEIKADRSITIHMGAAAKVDVQQNGALPQR